MKIYKYTIWLCIYCGIQWRIRLRRSILLPLKSNSARVDSWQEDKSVVLEREEREGKRQIRKERDRENKERKKTGKEWKENGRRFNGKEVERTFGTERQFLCLFEDLKERTFK